MAVLIENALKSINKQDKRVRGAPKGGLRTQEFRKEPSYDGDVCPCEV